MPRRDVGITLRQMRDYTREATQMAQGRTRAELDTNRMLSLALTHLLEILGEAANRVPAEEQAKYPHIPWQQLIGLRNRLIHGYDQVDLDILWQIVTRDLPSLTEELARVAPPE